MHSKFHYCTTRKYEMTIKCKKFEMESETYHMKMDNGRFGINIYNTYHDPSARNLGTTTN